jgi:hypothetical protein
MTKRAARTAESGGPDRFRHLPEPVRIEDTVTTKDEVAHADPEAGRDTNRDFMLRYAG